MHRGRMKIEIVQLA